MLFLHELHTVAGRHEDAFERTFREGFMPEVAEDDGARLLYFLRIAHGTGRAYHVVTITALRDGNAYERLAERVQRGDLRSWAADTDRMRHEVRGKVLLAVEWSPLREIDLAAVPTDGREHDPVLYMQDSAWPYEGMLDTYLEKARTHYAPSLEQQTTRRCSHCSACSRPRSVHPGGAKSCCGNASTTPSGCPRCSPTNSPRA